MIGGMLVAGVVLIVVVAVLSQRGNMTQETAKKATTTAQQAQTAVKDKAPKAALAQTDKRARSAKKAAVQVRHDLTVVTRVVKETQTVLGLGPRGLTGRNGRDAMLTFTLQGLLDALSPLVVGRLSDRLDATLPDVVRETCGGSCKGDPGSDGTNGKDAPPVTPEAISAAVAANCGGSCKGDPGVNGTNGVDGQPGVNGVDGQPGANGQDGAPGTPGTIVLSVQTACPDGNGGFVAGVATDPDGDGNFTCP